MSELFEKLDNDMSLLVGLTWLREQGAVIRIEYNWYNDEGEIQGFNVEDAKGDTIDIPNKLRWEIEEYFLKHSPGGYGSFTINLVDGTIIERTRYLGED